MTYLGRGDANKYNPQHANGKWVMRGSVFMYQTSPYMTWGTVAAGLNWAPVSSMTGTIKYGAGIVGFGPPGALVAGGPDVVGSRIRVVATMTPEWSAALIQPDRILACIGQGSEGIAGTTAAQPESQSVETTADGGVASPMTIQRQLVWDGSPLQVFMRHQAGSNVTQNIHTEDFQMSVEFV